MHVSLLMATQSQHKTLLPKIPKYLEGRIMCVKVCGYGDVRISHSVKKCSSAKKLCQVVKNIVNGKIISVNFS